MPTKTNEINIKDAGTQLLSAHNQRTPSSLPLNGKQKTNRNIEKTNN